jgi:ATP-dependent RNA helicase DBP3
MLVVAPTRELALQTFDVVEKAVPAVCVFGGVSKSGQQQELQRKKPIVVVGTPGRIVDFLSDDTLNLSEVGYFVLDEADRMLDLGFEPDIKRMVDKLPSNRQTIMFSATWPTSIRQMASRYLKSPITIMIGEARGEAKACATVKQIVEVIKDPNARDSRLITLLNQYHKKRDNRVLIFVLYKKEATRV